LYFSPSNNYRFKFFFPHNLNVGTVNLILLFVGSIIWPLGALVAFNANKKVDVGIFAVINNLTPVFTLVIAIPFLHESLKGPQWFGVGLLVSAGILAASSQLKKYNRANSDGIVICVLSTATFGVAIAELILELPNIRLGVTDHLVGNTCRSRNEECI
jgi:drug/metabolite transporter (DMT)-like permease